MEIRYFQDSNFIILLMSYFQVFEFRRWRNRRRISSFPIRRESSNSLPRMVQQQTKHQVIIKLI